MSICEEDIPGNSIACAITVGDVNVLIEVRNLHERHRVENLIEEAYPQPYLKWPVKAAEIEELANQILNKSINKSIEDQRKSHLAKYMRIPEVGNRNDAIWAVGMASLQLLGCCGPHQPWVVDVIPSLEEEMFEEKAVDQMYAEIYETYDHCE